MKKGDCFHGDIDGGDNPHYWLVLCDPKNGEVALVNFTSPQGGRMAHTVSKIFFPTLAYDSELAWFEAVIRDADEIEEMIESAFLDPRDPMPCDKVDTVLFRAGTLGVIQKEISKFLK